MRSTTSRGEAGPREHARGSGLQCFIAWCTQDGKGRWLKVVAYSAACRTCHDLAQNSAGDVAVDAAAVAALAAGLGATSVQSSAVYVRIPIKFESVQAEVGARRGCSWGPVQSAAAYTVDPAASVRLWSPSWLFGLGITSTLPISKCSELFLSTHIPTPPLQINYLALYHLLDFGSGWDALLLEKARRDAHEVRRGEAQPAVLFWAR